MPEATAGVSTIDYAVILAYLVLTVGLGVRIGRRLKTGADYFLGGRHLPWWAIGMSLVATDIGGTDIIGVGGAAYQHGIAVANFEWIGCVPAMIVAAFVFVPFFYRSGRLHRPRVPGAALQRRGPDGAGRLLDGVHGLQPGRSCSWRRRR